MVRGATLLYREVSVEVLMAFVIHSGWTNPQYKSTAMHPVVIFEQQKLAPTAAAATRDATR